MTEYEGDQVEDVTFSTDYADSAAAPLTYTVSIGSHHGVTPSVYAAVHTAVTADPTWPACRAAWLAADASLDAAWLDGLSGYAKGRLVKHFRRAPALTP